MALSAKQRFFKRLFDLLLAAVLLVVLWLPILLLLITATISTGSFGLYSQLRIGKNAKPFKLLKIRTLKGDANYEFDEITKRTTLFGKWLQKTKMNELPQLWNVLVGTMSFVGPRPDLPGYADQLKGKDRLLLSVKPGVTGPATIKYRNEESILAGQEDPKNYNDTVIWPDKVAINTSYVNNWSFTKDLQYLFQTLTNR